jgi:hypothetical protein
MFPGTSLASLNNINTRLGWEPARFVTFNARHRTVPKMAATKTRRNTAPDSPVDVLEDSRVVFKSGQPTFLIVCFKQIRIPENTRRSEFFCEEITVCLELNRSSGQISKAAAPMRSLEGVWCRSLAAISWHPAPIKSSLHQVPGFWPPGC